MQSFDFKKFRPHLLIILGFAVLSLLYCYPQLQGKVLSQSDEIHWKAMAHEGMEWHKNTGENVLWTNSMFGGMPTYTFYVPVGDNYVSFIQTAVELLGKPAYFFFLAMLCFYILMMVLDIDKWLAGIGSAAYAFSTYNAIIIVAGHNTKMWSLAFLPAVIAGVLTLYRGKWWLGLALWTLSFSLMFGNNHFQIVYYGAIIIGFAALGALYMAIKQGKVAQWAIASVIIVITGVIAVMPDMASFLMQKEYAKQTMRGGQSEQTLSHDQAKKSGGLDRDYAFEWSNEIGETFCVLIPNLYGGSSDESLGSSSNTYEAMTKIGANDDQAGQVCEQLPMYWGDQPFLSGPTYFGAIICFLFVLGLIIIRSPHKWWIAAVCLLAIVMSWGKHFAAFNYFLFDHLPYFNNFRVPSMIMIIPQFLFPVLGIWAVNDIITGKLEAAELWKKVKVATIITGGLCLLLGVGGSIFFDFRSPGNDAQITQQFTSMLGGNQQAAEGIVKAIHEDRVAMASKSGLISAVYILLAAGLIWAYSKKRIKAPVLLGGLGLLIVIDLVNVDQRYLNESKFRDESDYEAAFEPRPVDQQIDKDPDPYYRVLDLTKDVYNDAMQAYFHKSIGGYSAAKLELYQDLIDVQMGGKVAKGKFNAQVLNMLNTKYIIFGGGPNGQPAAMPNPQACGNAWFVNEAKIVNTANDELLSLNANSLGDTTKMPNAFDPKKTAIIRDTYNNELNGYTFGKDSSAYVRLKKYGLDDISFTSNNNKDGLAVFSDIWYPYGWEAYIDGKETAIIRADYLLRAIKIPHGIHTIEFHFRPKSFTTGNNIALVGSVLVWGLVLGAIAQGFRKNKDQDSVKA